MRLLTEYGAEENKLMPLSVDGYGTGPDMPFSSTFCEFVTMTTKLDTAIYPGVTLFFFVCSNSPFFQVNNLIPHSDSSSTIFCYCKTCIFENVI
jgi:hypothetical protein